jgi:hypothetical protein
VVIFRAKQKRETNERVEREQRRMVGTFITYQEELARRVTIRRKRTLATVLDANSGKFAGSTWIEDSPMAQESGPLQR